MNLQHHDKYIKYRNKLMKKNVANIKQSNQKEIVWVCLQMFIALFQAVINIFACFLFIFETYSSSSSIDIIGLAIGIYFTIEMTITFYYHPKPKYLYFEKHEFWIDFLTIVPEYLQLLSFSGSLNVGFLRILRVFKIMRIVKFTKTFQKLQLSRKTHQMKPLEEVRQRKLNKDLLFMVVTMFAILFITTGIVLFMQDSTKDSTTEDMKFIDALYFVETSGYVIGYGDILFKNASLRIILAFIISIMLLITSNQITRIVSSIRESDKYDVKYNLKNHIIVFTNKSIEITTSFVLHYLSYNPEDKILIVDDI